MRLEGKVAIITGATFGIGRATAQLFAREGAKVVAVGRTAEAGESLIEEIRSDGGQATFVRTDVSDSGDVQRMIATAVNSYGKLDVLFNNAGIVTWGKLADELEEDWDRCIDINLKGVFLGIKYAVPAMIKNGGGSIINNSSIWGVAASHRGGVAYHASKGGVIMLTKKAALDYGSESIRVNSIVPGDIAMIGDAPDEYWQQPDVVKDRLGRQPLPRVGMPMDVAPMVVFLASDDAAFVTGATFVVDGGNTMTEYGALRGPV